MSRDASDDYKTRGWSLETRVSSLKARSGTVMNHVRHEYNIPVE